MKIWYQSMSIYRYSPSHDEYGKILEEQCRRAARPDTEIYVTGVPTMMSEFVKYKTIKYYHTNQCLNNMLRAEKEGYDAFIIGCSSDVGMDEGREMLSIPVVGIGHTSFYLAAMLGELFAIVTCQPVTAERYRQSIVRYGLQSKHRGSYIFSITEDEMAKILKEPEPVAEKFKAVAKKAVADGASVIVPLPAMISQLFYKTGGLTNLDGALVLDPVAAVVKFAEMLADLKKLGIEVSRMLGAYGSLGKELLKKVHETYGPGFKIGS